MATKSKKTSTGSKSRKSELVAPLYTKAGKGSGTVSLPKEIFGQEPNATLVAQAVRVFLARQRKAHAATKSRGQVSATTAKLYKQKGTGRARHGARSAPIFVGGGRAHGPRGNQNWQLRMPRKAAQLAFAGALSDKAADKKVVVADIENIDPKTRILAAFLKKIYPAIGGVKRLYLVHAASQNLVRAGRNIKGVCLVRADQLNTYDVVASSALVLTRQALGKLEERGKKDVA